jgi:hypothetical protein
MIHVREPDVSGVRVPGPHARTLKHLLAPWTSDMRRPGQTHRLVNTGERTFEVLSMVSPPFERDEYDTTHRLSEGKHA